jgi:alpha-glucosidase
VLPQIGGGGLAASMRALTAGVPWRSVTSSMTLLDSHDTARFASSARSTMHHHVAAGLLLTSPGVPSIFAGDEVGVTGADSDAGRQPFPWDDSRWDTELFATFRALITLRRQSEPLRRGSRRFVAAGEDAIAFVRETADETVLVHASRAPHEPLRIGRGDLGMTATAARLYGDGELKVVDGAVELPDDGPAFNVWRL